MVRHRGQVVRNSCTAFSAGQRACCHRLQATPVQAPRHVRPQPCHSRCNQQQVAAAEPAAHILKLQHHVGIGGHKLGRSASAGRGRVCVAGLHTRTSVLFDARQALLKSPMLKSSRQQVCKSHACKRAASRMHAGTLDAQGITAGAPCPPVCMPAAASSFIDRSCSSRASFLSSPTTSCKRGHGKKQREPNEQDWQWGRGQCAVLLQCRRPPSQAGCTHCLLCLQLTARLQQQPRWPTHLC